MASLVVQVIYISPNKPCLSHPQLQGWVAWEPSHAWPVDVLQPRRCTHCALFVRTHRKKNTWKMTVDFQRNRDHSQKGDLFFFWHAVGNPAYILRFLYAHFFKNVYVPPFLETDKMQDSSWWFFPPLPKKEQPNHFKKSLDKPSRPLHFVHIDLDKFHLATNSRRAREFPKCWWKVREVSPKILGIPFKIQV